MVHAHGMWEHVWPAFQAAQTIRARCFVTAHGTWQFLFDTPGFEKKARQLKYKAYYHTLWRYMVMKSTAMIALNAVENRAHQALGAGRIHRIPNGVDCCEFSPHAGAYPLSDISPDNGYILFAGAVQAQKGIFTLLSALGQLKQKGITLPVVVAGEGPDRTAAEQRAAADDLPVIFAGRVPRERMPALMARAGLFVLPSINETFATAYLEAMACGTPCVGTCTGGTPEIIDHHINGVLISPHSSTGLSRVLQAYARTPELFHLYGKKAREKAWKTFDWSILVPQILSAYGAATGGVIF